MTAPLLLIKQADPDSDMATGESSICYDVALPPITTLTTN
jgi:hypothetical protein